MKIFGNKETLSKTAFDLKESLNLLPPPPVKFSLPSDLIKNNANQGVFDVHVHMGQYFDDYYTPPKILRTLKLAGIPFLLVKQVPFLHLSIPFIP